MTNAKISIIFTQGGIYGNFINARDNWTASEFYSSQLQTIQIQIEIWISRLSEIQHGDTKDYFSYYLKHFKKILGYFNENNNNVWGL